MSRPAAVIVLAAGQGTRMKSALPKVVHPLSGLSMIGHALRAAHGLDPEHLGAKNSLVYAGRGRVVVRGESATTKDTDDEAGDGLSIAERRRAARLAAAKAEEETVDDASGETTDDAADVTEEEEN